MVIRLIITACLFFPVAGFSQHPPSLVKQLDSLYKIAHSAGHQVNDIHRSAYNSNTRINPHVYFILLGSDLKQELTAPFHFTKKDWLITSGVALLTASMTFADKPIQQYAVKLENKNKIVSDLSRSFTRFGIPYQASALGAYGVYGFILKKEKAKTTALLVSQAYIAGGALEILFKFLTHRDRPFDVDSISRKPEPTFHGPFYTFGKDNQGKRLTSSFPSGHATVAFAAATVFAMEYKDRPLVPVIAYSAATLISLSRVTENRHWATDILTGAVLGYLTGRKVVNNYHRYAKLKELQEQEKKNTISFNLQYNNGQLMPGLIYIFR